MVYNYSAEDEEKDKIQFSGRLYTALSSLEHKIKLTQSDRPNCLSELLNHGAS